MGDTKLEESTPTTKGTAKVDDVNRGNWSHQCDFFLSCLGYAVGLGNVWRFPYLAYNNGGGAFLVPYLLFLFLAGLPLFFMELSLGQYASLGPNIIFRKIAPVFQGVGYTMLFICFLIVIYYNMIIAWTLFYMLASFTSELPWQFCGAEWTSTNCYTKIQDEMCKNSTGGVSAMTYWNKSCTDVAVLCDSNDNLCYDGDMECIQRTMSAYNDTHCLNNSAVVWNEDQYMYIALKNATHRASPSEEYFDKYVLSRSEGWHDFGVMRWQLVLCLLLAWTIVTLCLIKGVKSSGKVVYFTALFPYVVLVAFFIKGLTLDGAIDGILFFITPDLSKLTDSLVWAQAATQIFYSLGVSFGCLITLSSYNKFRNNCERDAIVIALCNCSTSVFAGFVIFSVVGSLAHDLDVPVGKVIKGGTGLAFIAYPDAITRLPIPQLWSVLFFVLILTLGLDSQFSMVEALTTGVMDKFPKLRRKKHLVVIATGIIGFLLGLPLCMEGGIYMFTLIDGYCAGWSLLMCAVAEVIAVAFVYGHHNLKEEAKAAGGYFKALMTKSRYFDNLEEMLGHQPFIYWRVMWQFFTPLVIMFILIFSLIQYTPATYGDVVFPVWANTLGWLMACGSVILIPIFAIYRWIDSCKTGEALFEPTSDWGPSSSLHLSKSKAEVDEHHVAAYDNFSYEPSQVANGSAETTNV